MSEKKPILAGLEENLVLIPVGISLLLVLVSFVMQFFAPEEAVAAVQQASFYAYAWVFSLSLAMCARDNKHLRVPVLEDKLSENAKHIEFIIHDILGLIVLIVMLVVSVQILGQTIADGVMDEKAPMLPLWIAYAAPVAGYALACIRSLLRIFGKGEK